MSKTILKPTAARPYSVEINVTSEASAPGVAQFMAAAYAEDGVCDAVLLVTTREGPPPARNLRVAAPSNEFSEHHNWWLNKRAVRDAVLVIDAQPLWHEGRTMQVLRKERAHSITQVVAGGVHGLRRVVLFVDEAQLQDWVDLYAK